MVTQEQVMEAAVQELKAMALLHLVVEAKELS
jgi:hypothetical protein